jgi:hypothetical protein
MDFHIDLSEKKRKKKKKRIPGGHVIGLYLRRSRTKSNHQLAISEAKDLYLLPTGNSYIIIKNKKQKTSPPEARPCRFR